MAKIQKIGNRRISVKAKYIAKAKDVSVSETAGNLYIEILPSYSKELTANEINNLYLSFLNLGRTLYHENKELGNILKIRFNKYGLEETLDNRYILKTEPKIYINEYLEQTVKEWINENHLWYKENSSIISTNFFIKSNDNFRMESLIQWLKDNFVPIEKESDRTPWLYVNFNKVIDLSIFIYLVSYAISGVRHPKVSNSIDNIKFSDFIELDGHNDELDDINFLSLVNEIIEMFEMHNIYSLYGYNKLKYIKEEERFEMTTEYNDIYAVIWYVFKLYIVDNFSYFDIDAKQIPINICNNCGSPFIGTTRLCDNCSMYDDARRKAKSRRIMFTNVDKIRKLVNNYEFPNNLLKSANKYINMSNTQLYKCNKGDIDKILLRLENYINKRSKSL